MYKGIKKVYITLLFLYLFALGMAQTVFEGTIRDLFSHNVGNVTVRISDTNGTVCFYKNMAMVMKTCKLNLTNLNKGDYTIEIEDENARHHWVGVFQL